LNQIEDKQANMKYKKIASMILMSSSSLNIFIAAQEKIVSAGFTLAEYIKIDSLQSFKNIGRGQSILNGFHYLS
jgi:hypothetical protein